MAKARVLVTGANGFSGGYITKYLHEKSYPVFTHRGHKSGDLSCGSTLWSLPADVDILIHTAAVSPGADLTSLVGNIEATRNLIAWAKGRGRVRTIIFFSSVSLYGEVPDGVLKLDSPRINPGVYGETKHICEELLFESSITTIALRLPAIVGKGAKRHSLAHAVEALKASDHVLHIFNPQSLFNNAVHIEFLCQLIERLIERPRPSRFEPLLLGSKEPLRFVAALDVLASLLRGSWVYNESEGAPSFTIDISSVAQIMEPWSLVSTLRRYAEDEA